MCRNFSTPNHTSDERAISVYFPLGVTFENTKQLVVPIAVVSQSCLLTAAVLQCFFEKQQRIEAGSYGREMYVGTFVVLHVEHRLQTCTIRFQF